MGLGIKIGKLCFVKAKKMGSSKFMRDMASVIWTDKLPYICLDKNKLKKNSINQKEIKFSHPEKIELYLSKYLSYSYVSFDL